LLPDLQVFLASKAGEIPTDEDWLAHIHQNLKAAMSFSAAPLRVTTHV
jgi:hypothetical protein